MFFLLNFTYIRVVSFYLSYEYKALKKCSHQHLLDNVLISVKYSRLAKRDLEQVWNEYLTDFNQILYPIDWIVEPDFPIYLLKDASISKYNENKAHRAINELIASLATSGNLMLIELRHELKYLLEKFEAGDRSAITQVLRTVEAFLFKIKKRIKLGKHICRYHRQRTLVSLIRDVRQVRRKLLRSLFKNMDDNSGEANIIYQYMINAFFIEKIKPTNYVQTRDNYLSDRID